MENNQEHKIDSFFKKSLENQAFPPPENLWANIAAETIAKKDKGISPRLKYMAYLGLLVIGGWVFWLVNDTHAPDNQTVKDNASMLANQALTGTKGINPANRVGRIYQNTISQLSNSTEVTSKSNMIANTSPSYYSTPQKRYLQTFQSAKIQQRTDVYSQQNSDDISFIPEQQIASFLPTMMLQKGIVPIDLSEKYQQLLSEKVLPIQLAIDSDTNSKSGGAKLSLKHPTISLDYGLLSNTISYNPSSSNSLNNKILYPEKSSAKQLKLTIAWKITEKSRMGIAVAYTNYNLSVPYYNIPPWSSYWGVPAVSLSPEGQYYRAVLPLGTANIPVERFNGLPTKSPNTLDSTRQVIFSDNNIMNTISLAITTQNDLITLQNKKKKYFNLKLYAIADFTFQQPIHYSYEVIDVQASLSSSMVIAQKGILSESVSQLENASKVVFGTRLGLGIRWQFSPILGIFVEGTTQGSLNSWMKNQEFNTKIRANILNWGINFNL